MLGGTAAGIEVQPLGGAAEGREFVMTGALPVGEHSSDPEAPAHDSGWSCAGPAPPASEADAAANCPDAVVA
jgi:hypothetical protein